MRDEKRPRGRRRLALSGNPCERFGERSRGRRARRARRRQQRRRELGRRRRRFHTGPRPGTLADASTQDVLRHFFDAGTAKPAPASDHLVQHDAQRPDVVGFLRRTAGRAPPATNSAASRRPGTCRRFRGTARNPATSATRPNVNPMLLGLTSPCKDPAACSAASPSARTPVTETASAAGNGPCRGRSASVPPGRNSTTRKGRPRHDSMP